VKVVRDPVGDGADRHLAGVIDAGKIGAAALQEWLRGFDLKAVHHAYVSRHVREDHVDGANGHTSAGFESRRRGMPLRRVKELVQVFGHGDKSAGEEFLGVAAIARR
jgi:hypothetical protein